MFGDGGTVGLDISAEISRIAASAVPRSVTRPEFAVSLANLACVLGPRTGLKLAVGPELCGSFSNAAPLIEKTLLDATSTQSIVGVLAVAISIDPSVSCDLAACTEEIRALIDSIQHERLRRAHSPEAVIAEESVAKNDARLWFWLLISWLRALSLDLPILALGPVPLSPEQMNSTFARLDAVSRTTGSDPFTLSVVQVRMRTDSPS